MTELVATRRTSALAVTGFVLALLVAPVGLVVSILGVIETKKGEKSGFGLAIAGVVIGALWILVVAVVAITAMSVNNS